LHSETKSTIFHNKIAESYEAQYNSNYWRLYFDITFASMKKFLPKKGSRILDAGGGTGFWSRKLAKLGYKMVCTDIAEKMLLVGAKLAKRERLGNLIEFREADIMRMDCFEDNSFDMVLSEGDAVGYCGNPNKAIKELCRVAKKGAFVVVSVDSFFSRLNRLILKNDLDSIKILEKSHKTKFPEGNFFERDFTVPELKELFEKNRLSVVEIIGKPIFAKSIPKENIERMLSNKKAYRKILELELKYCNEQSIAGFGSHLQIIGKKI